MFDEGDRVGPRGQETEASRKLASPAAQIARWARYTAWVIGIGLFAACTSAGSGSDAPQIEESSDSGVADDGERLVEGKDSSTSPLAEMSDGLSLYVGASPKVHRLDLGSGEWATFSIGGSPVFADEDWLVTHDLPGVRALRLDEPEGNPVDLGLGDVAWGPASPEGHLWQRSPGVEEFPRYRLREIATGEEVFALSTSIAWPPTGVFDPQLTGQPVTGIFAFDNGEYKRVSEDRLLAAGLEHVLSRSCQVPTECTTRWLDRSTGSELRRPIPDRDAEDYVLSADGRLVAGLSASGESWVFDADTDSYVIENARLRSDIYQRNFSLAPDGTLVAVVSDEGEIVVHDVDTGGTRTIETESGMGRVATVLLTRTPGANLDQPRRTAIADYPPDKAAVPELLVSAERAFDPSQWTAQRIEPGQSLPGVDVGVTLLSGDRNDLTRLDLTSGLLDEWTGVGVPMRRAGDWVVFSGDGSIKASLGRSPQEVVEVLTDPIYFNMGTPANLTRPGQRPGEIWLNTFTDQQPESVWRLVDLNTDDLGETIPAAWWHQYTTLTGATDQIQTSESGGVFELTDTGYQQVLDGTLKAVSDSHILTETCSGPGRCAYQWFSRDDWSEVNWPQPPSPVFHGSLSDGGRLLHYWSHEGLAYIEAATGSLVHLQLDSSIRDDVSTDGRYVTATYKGNLDTYILADLDTYTIYTVPMNLTPGSSMPVLTAPD